MNNLHIIKSAIVCLAVSFVALTGCSKDDPKPTEKEIIEDFLNKSYEDQVKAVDQELSKWENKTYVLSSLKVYNEDGTTTETLGVDDCANYRTITIKAKENQSDTRNYHLKEIEGGEECGVYQGIGILSLSESEYSDYKVVMNFIDTKNQEPFESFNGVLKLIDGTSNFFTVYAGDFNDADGKFTILKEFTYRALDN